MVIAVKDIVDAKSLEAWLNERPKDLRRQCAIFLNSREAARVLPNLVAFFWLSDEELSPLDFFKVLLESFVFVHSEERVFFPSLGSARPNFAIVGAKYVANSKNLESRAHAENLSHSYLATGFSLTIFGTLQKLILDSEAVIDPTFSNETRFDIGVWDRHVANSFGGNKFAETVRLWPDANSYEKTWAELKVEMIADATSDDPRSADWWFWIDWYDGLLEGRAQNIDMLLEIATTDKINWKAPPREVNEVIEEIVEEFENPALIAIRKKMAELQSALTSEKQKNRGEIKALNNKHQDEIAALNNQHEAALQSVVAQDAIKGPSKLWDDKRDEHEKKYQTAYWLFIGALVVMAIALGGVAYWLICGNVSQLFLPYGCDLQFAPELCSGISLKGTIVSIIFATMLTLGFWFIRVQLKVFLSERHLMLDARERMAFADAYVSLLQNKDNAEGAAEQGLIVYNALFRPTSDGIIKEDGGVDPSLSGAIAKFLAK